MVKYLLSFRYVGNKYECPFCMGHFSAFLPTGFDFPVLKEKQVIGGGYRLNAVCPRCYSVDRERLIYLYLNNYRPVIFSNNISLLHIAPEMNLSKKLKSYPNIKYISGDLNPKLADIQIDITDIKQDDETYDVIICNHVLEHILDDGKAMRELFRVLNKGGFAILQVPISYQLESTFEDSAVKSQNDRETIFGQEDHVRIYGKDYVQRLVKAGFSVTEYDWSESNNPEEYTKYGLVKNEKVFVCSKL